MASNFATTTVALLLLLVAGLGLATYRTTESPSMALDYWRPGPDELSQLRDVFAQRLKACPPKATYATLLDALIRHNHAASGLDQLEFRQGLILLEREMSQRAKAFIEGHGATAFLAVGDTLAEQLYRDLVAVGESLNAEGQPLQDWLDDHAEDQRLNRLRGLSGRFLERAVGAGLLSHHRPPERDRMLVARALWMERWALMGGLQPEAVLDSTETRLSLRWKIEAAEHLDLGRRRQLLAVASARLPQYPATYIEGVLFMRAGEIEEAASRFLDCIAEDEEVALAGAWLRTLRQFSWDSLL